jgi:hypothetical protein
MARNNNYNNDDWEFDDAGFGEQQERSKVQPRYNAGPRPNANRGNQPQMRGVPQTENGFDREYQGQYQQGGYNNQQHNSGGQNPNEPNNNKKDPKKTSRLKKVVIGLIVSVVVIVLLWGAVKLVKVKDKNRANEGNKTTQTSKKAKKVTTEDTTDSKTEDKAKDEKKESISDIGGTKDSSAKEKLDTKSIESEVYSNTATVKTVELITTGKLTASYHFVFEMGSTQLDMYLNEFEAENLKVGDKVKISFKKIPSKDKVVITDIQRA